MPRATPNLVPGPQQVVSRLFSVGRELRRGQGWERISGLAEAPDPGADNKQASGSLRMRVQRVCGSPGPAWGRALGDGVVEAQRGLWVGVYAACRRCADGHRHDRARERLHTWGVLKAMSQEMT